MARGLGWLRWTPGPRSLAPAGFVAGGSRPPAAPASSSPPLLLAAGLRGDAFIATASASAFAMHVARIVGYGSAGLVSASTLGASAVLAVGLIGGNLAGRRLRGVLGDAGALRVTYGVMVTMVALALAGVA
ncbi:MAG TPA: hypothetical protein RMH99_10760 [Sandaracinaceae bacterium LLY-WYZ-13_1]|nr:hypothetical protein [Sandaracinaceae bacterium LLY-WYZ-13_1]